MTNQLLDIQPRDLKFIFELKKQSACSVRVVNKTDFLVAYKVKTTSPKKYCVRPNVGIVKPRSACDFIVTMQAQKAAPPDLICKDKFLLQSAIVPDGTTEEDITSDMFVKDEGKHVEDSKLKVILVSPPHSPELSPRKGERNQMPAQESTLLENRVFNGIDITSQQEDKNLEHVNLHNSHIIEKIASPTQKNTGVDIVEDATTQNSKDSKDINVPREEIIEDVSLQKQGTSGDLKAWKNDSIGDTVAQKDSTIKETTSSTKYDSEGKGLQKHRTSEDINVRKNDITGDINVQKENTIAGIIPPTKHNTGDVILDGEMARTATKSVSKNSAAGSVVADVGIKKDVADLELAKDFETIKSKNSVAGSVVADIGIKKDVADLELAKDFESMKSKLNDLESKLREAEITISRLTEERRLNLEERERLRKEVSLQSSTVVRKRVQVGFPFLYVVVVAFVSMVLGYRFRC